MHLNGSKRMSMLFGRSFLFSLIVVPETHTYIHMFSIRVDEQANKHTLRTKEDKTSNLASLRSNDWKRQTATTGKNHNTIVFPQTVCLLQRRISLIVNRWTKHSYINRGTVQTSYSYIICLRSQTNSRSDFSFIFLFVGSHYLIQC